MSMYCRFQHHDHKQPYHFNISEIYDGTIREVMNFNVLGRHDLATLSQRAAIGCDMSQEDAEQLVLGVVMLCNVMERYPENILFQEFHSHLSRFRHDLRGQICAPD